MAAQNSSPAPSSNNSPTRIPPVPPQLAKPKPAEPAPKRVPGKRFVDVGALPFWAGLVFSAAWIGLVLIIVAGSGPSHVFGGLPLVDWAIGISAIVSPVALIWMVAAYMQRAADIKSVADPLRRQLSIITGESGAAEARIRRFNGAIREQIELLKNAQSISHNDLAAIMNRVRQHKDELERFEHSSVQQVKEIQEIVRRNMQQVEQLMDDKFTMLRVLDGRLVQNGDAVARQTEAVRDQVAGLLQEIESHSQQVADTLEHATTESKKLADVSRAQEATLVNATENAAETLNNLSGRIDLSVARFLERAGTAREEAERLAGALDAQTRSLDEFSNNLPARVGEAESVIRGVADRLYASEQLAREQAVLLSDKLSEQVDGLQAFMDRFTARLSDIDGGLDRRRADLDALAGRIGETTSEFVSAWEKSIFDLNDRTTDTLTRFTDLNDVSRKSADAVARELLQVTTKYEDAATRMNGLSQDSSTQMKSMTAEITNHLTQFEALSEASRKAGVEVESRASAAMQNLQYVLERLLTAREATQTVGDTLVKDLYNAVDQNEQLVTRLNEAAQMSVRALGIASESLGKQEGELADRTRVAEASLKEAVTQLQTQAEVAEKGLRQQAQGLIALLTETQGAMSITEQKLQSLATTAVTPIQDAVKSIDASADQGLQSLSRYGDGLGGQLTHLQQFHARVGSMGEDLTRVTAETLGTIEDLNNRFIGVRTLQEDSARQTLQQFGDLSDRLQREVAGLDGQTAQAVASLQKAAAAVGEQSYQLLQNAENSGAKMQLVTSALQNEATQIRSILQKQTDDLGADLSRAEKQFTALGDVLKQRTDTAYTLLDRVAAHYNETTRTAANDLDARTERLEEVTSQVQNKTETMTAALVGQLTALTSGVSQLDTQSTIIASASGKALQQLSSLNEKIVVTGETANANARQIVTRLEESGTAFLRQSNALAEAAQNSTTLIQKAGGAFGEQAGKLLDSSHHIDQNLRQLTAATATFADQSAQIRTAMEQQNQRLATSITETITQLETVSYKLEQTASTAAITADEASSRFNEMTTSSSTRLGNVQNELQSMATRTETILSSLGSGIAQQSTTLGALNEQLSDQYRNLSSATESQRTQLVELFDKLGAAHGQASEVAERTIARLADQVGQIQRDLGMLSDQSQTAIGNVRAATAGFADQSVTLLQNAQNAEQQARSIVNVTAGLQDQARQLRESMQDESTRAGEMLGGLLAKLSASGIELRDISSATDTALNGVSTNISQQSQALNGTMQQISDRQRSLTSALDAQRETLNGLLNRLTLAQDETAATAERTAARLNEGTQQIVRQTEIMGNTTQATLANIHAANDAFATESSQLMQNAQSAEQQAKTVLAVTTSLADQTRQLRETMNSESERAGDMLGSLISRLTTGGNELRDVSSSTEASLQSLQINVTQQTQALTTNMHQIGDRQRNLTAALDQQQEALAGLVTRLNVAQDETAATAERTAARLNEGTQQIMRQTEVMAATTQTALTSVQAANETFAAESSQLVRNAQSAEQQAKTVLAVTTSLADQTRQLRETMNSESERAGDMLGSLISQLTTGGNELREVSSSTEVSLQSLHTNVTQQTQSLTSSMHQISDRQRSLTTALDQQQETLTSLLMRLNVAQDETAATAERTVSRLNEGTQQIVRQAENIGDLAQAALVNVQTANSGFTAESSQLVQNAQSAEQHAKSVLATTTALADQTRQLRETMHGEGERAHEMLGSLISRLTTGGNELREFGSSTEANLHSLHNNVMQQAQTLTNVMQQIADRQRTLTTAMDAQRDVLNGLLSRLNIAQDETASVAERTAARMVDGAQQVARQIDIIDGQAQNALANVQAANSGFADQAGSLSLQAQQAEQHMRNILSVTAGLQEQARQLREAMQAETSQAVEQLNKTIAQLDTTNQHLKTQSGTAIQAMDQTALQFATLAHTSADAMNKQSELLRASAQTAEDRVGQAGEKMREQLKSVADIGSQAEAQARQLADVAEYATNRLVTLRETITDSDRDGQNVLDSTTRRVNDVKETLHNELARLSELSQRAVEQVLQASQGLTQQSDTLRANLAMSESALERAADLVRQEAQQIPSMLDRSATQIEGANRQLKAQAEDADNTLVGTADRFITVTMTARESMVEEMRRVSSTAEQADKILSQFSTSLSTQMSSIKENTAQLSTEQLTLVEKATESVAQLAAASDRLAHLRSDAAQTAEKLAREFDTLDQRATSTGSRLVQTSETLAKNVEALSLVTQRAESQMMGASSQFRDQLERIRGGLQGQIDDINRGLMQITAQLERTGNTLRSTTAGTVVEVEKIAQRLDQTNKEASTNLTEKTARMRGATEEVAALLTGFGDQLDVLLDRLSMAGDGIRRQEGGMVDQLQQALTHLATVSERLEAGRQLATNVSEQTSARLTEVVETVQREMNSLTNGTQAAAGIMRGIGQIYGEQSASLNNGVRDAHGQVLAMNKSVDEMQQRTDRMRVSLKLQSEELMASLSQILNQLSSTGDALGDTVDQVLRDQATAGLKKIG